MSVLVVLNGTSSSGKTTVARAFQDAAPDVFLNFSIDSILTALPPSVLQRIVAGAPVEELRLPALVRSFYACAHQLLEMGHDLVIDHALTARYHVEALLPACENHERCSWASTVPSASLAHARPFGAIDGSVWRNSSSRPFTRCSPTTLSSTRRNNRLRTLQQQFSRRSHREQAGV